MAGGGASGLNIVPIARELGCRACCCPSHGRCALGLRRALLRHHLRVLGSRYAETRSLDLAGVNDALAAVEAERGRVPRRASPTSAPIATRKDFLVDARYRAQVWELDVPIPGSPRERGRRARARGDLPRDARARLRRARAGAVPRVPALEGARDGRAREARGARARAVAAGGTAGAGDYARAYFRETGRIEVPTLRRRASLAAGARIEGPAIIREPTTTVVVYPGSVGDGHRRSATTCSRSEDGPRTRGQSPASEVAAA